MEKLDLENVRVYSNTKDDIIDAMNLIGQEVYISHHANFEDYCKRKLTGVKFTENNPYPFLVNDGENDFNAYYTYSYKYFILAKDVKFKEEEKKLRPFKTLDEFFDKFDFNIGETVTIKRINFNCESENEYGETSLFIGFRFHKCKCKDKESKITTIILGSNSYTFEELMNNYLYYKDGKWHSFGIKE